MHPTIALLGADLALTVAGTALWVTGAVLLAGAPGSRARALSAVATVVGALIALAGRVVALAVAGGSGWWFVAERVALGLPLAGAGAVVAVVGAGPVLVALARHRPVPARRRDVASAALVTAAVTSCGALAATAVVGFPVTPLGAAWLVGLTAGAVAVVWLVLVVRPPARVVASAGTVYALALALAGGWAWADDAAARVGPVAGAAGAHAAAVHGAAPVTATAALGTASPAPTPPATTPPATTTATGERRYTLTAREEVVTLASGTQVDAWTYGSLPGPALTATQGDVVRVTLRNADVAAGVTLHWHGYDVPNPEDGVAGVTQDAVAPGASHEYRFVAEQAGTYWYHTHQASAEGVRRGLYGTLVVRPRGAPLADVDLVLPLHTVDGTTLLGGSDVPVVRAVDPGATVRLRLVNTDSEPRRFAVTGAPYRVLAVDGDDLHDPQEIPGAGTPGTVLRVPAGGRYDVGLTMPAASGATVRLATGGAPGAGLVLAAPGTPAPGAVPFVDGDDLDLLAYGAPDAADARDVTRGTASDAPDVAVRLVLDRQLRVVHGVPAWAWTVNGRVWPHVPPVVVHEGDLVRIVVVNRSTETHPVHPHGHDVQVVARDGTPPRGSPLHLDTVDVRPGETWELLLRADNPGLWMSHCHDLDHAALGMVLHLAYAGATTPYGLGGHGDAPVANDPE
ncbi:multicopper oxidase family protein [Cellulosimicrobium marinum]|uniref:multicopper oxidase family protein n=1 Tax=Cellulosimicrobium marinum TaxID=1638992 RepID=UPI001E2B94DF|nr:multicopper oxidase family protein [Cellulosimicrobium marinum]MCB7135958.1 multicopper oxidase family protein [Cellulosimicrobium marinum]